MFVAKTHRIDDRSEILAGLRMTSDRSTGRWGYHQSPELAARQRKLEWAVTEANPKGQERWAADLDIADGGEIRIPRDAVEPYFHGKGAHLMLNIFCDMPHRAGYFATLGFFKKYEIYTFDSVEPQDSRGRWTYSRPIHLDGAGRKNFFFFMTLQSTGGPYVQLTVHKIEVVRGKEHYRLMRTLHAKAPVAHIDQLATLSSRVSELRDLPIAKLVAAYRLWNEAQ